MLRFFWHLGLSFMLLALTVALTVPVAAQGTPSQQQLAAGNELLQAGKAAYSAGRFAEALYDFEQAYQRLQRPSILYRIGDTADKLGEHERAISALRQYLDVQPQATDREFVESRIRANLEALQVAHAVRANNPALSPEAAARGANGAAATPPTTDDASHLASAKPPSVMRAWWLWAGAGTVAVASIVIVAVLMGSASARESPPVQGNVGGVVQTLGAP